MAIDLTPEEQVALRVMSRLSPPTPDQFSAIRLERDDGLHHYLFMDSDHSKHQELKRQRNANPQNNGHTTTNIRSD